VWDLSMREDDFWTPVSTTLRVLQRQWELPLAKRLVLNHE